VNAGYFLPWDQEGMISLPTADAATTEKGSKQANCQSTDFETKVSLDSENGMATLESFKALVLFMPAKCIAFIWQ
jgi:hypothetical protein